MRRLPRLAGLVGGALLMAAPLAATPTALPAYSKATLKNGLAVIVMPSRRLPLVDLRLVVNAGSVCDPPGQEGVAQLTADLLTQGAGRRSARQIADDIAFVGGTLSADAGTEQLVVSSEVLGRDLPLALELLRDCVVSPAFDPTEFDRKKQEQLGNLESGKNDPGTIANAALAAYLWGQHPLGHTPLGTTRAVGALSREQVVAFHRRFVTPDRAILAVVGDVDAKTLVPMLERAFATWQPAGGDRGGLGADYGPVPALAGRTVRIVSKPEVTQTQIRIACPSVSRNHPDYYALQVANTILGAGFTSRLVNSIRVEQGLTYSISSRFDQYRNAGAFRITTFTRNEQLQKCVDAVLAEVRRLVDDGPTDAEIDKGRNFLVGQFPLGLQGPDDLAAELANVEFYGLDPKFIETYGDRVRAVTRDDLKRVLARYFCTDPVRLLVVSDPVPATKALEHLGPVEVVPIE